VPEARAKQGGEVCARWAWTEGSVWTARLLTALENGVKGGVWHSLMDDHHRWPNAYFAAQGLYSLVAAHAAARQSVQR